MHNCRKRLQCDVVVERLRKLQALINRVKKKGWAVVIIIRTIVSPRMENYVYCICKIKRRRPPLLSLS